MERIITDFEIKYDFFYEKMSGFEWRKPESIYRAVCNKTKITAIAPYYNLPISGYFNFTGVIFKKLENDEHITLLEAVQNNIPYYYPLSELRERFYIGNLSNAEYHEGRSGLGKGRSFLKYNTNGVISDSNFGPTEILKTINLLIHLFNNEWSAKLVTGYVINHDKIFAVDKEQCSKTNWRSINFVIEKHFYILHS